MENSDSEIKQHKIFKDLPGNSKFHSCIISSFSFDYYYFDIQIRRQLNKIGIFNIIILCDANILEESYDRISSGTIHLLKDYTVIPIESSTCFHPKVMLFFGDNEIAMHLGSGNLSSGGLGKNHELFSTLYCDSNEDSQFPIIKASADYLVEFLKSKKGFVKKQLNWIYQYCTLYRTSSNFLDVTNHELDDGQSISLLANYHQSIYLQLLNLIPTTTIKNIEIVSPFFDKDLNFLNRLLTDFPNAIIDLYLQNFHVDIDLENIQDDRINLIDWSKTEIGKKKFKSGQKYNHSKYFRFNSNNSAYILHGSPNATSYAFGLNPKLKNNEIALLYTYTIDNNDEKFEIGLHPKIPLDTNQWTKRLTLPSPEESITTKLTKARILGADKFPNKIELYSKDIEKGDCLVFMNRASEIIETISITKNTERIIIQFKDNPAISSAFVLYIEREKKKISRSMFINEVTSLMKANPNPDNRKLQRLLMNIEIGKTNEFEVLSFLNTIQSEKGEVSQHKTTNKQNLKTNNQEPELNYQEAKLITQDNLVHDKFSSVKSIFNSQQALIHANYLNQKEREIDLDESGVKKGGGSEKEIEYHLYKKIKIFKSEEEFKKAQKKIRSIYLNYINLLRRKFNLEDPSKIRDNKILSSDLAMMSVLCNELLSLVNKKFTIVTDNKNNSEEKIEVSNIILPDVGLNKSLDSFRSIAYVLIGHFLFYVKSGTIQDYEDEYLNSELERYKNICNAYIQSILVLLYHLSRDKKDGLIWLFLLTQKYFGELDKKILDDRLRNFEICLNYEEFFEEKFNLINDDAKNFSYNPQEFLKINNIGMLRIYKKTPIDKPNVFRLSFPGIGYEANNIKDLFPKYFIKSKGKWVEPLKK